MHASESFTQRSSCNGTIASSRFHLRLCLLLGCGGLGLGGLLSVASDHDHAQEGAHNGRAEQDEDDGDSDGPDAGEEEVLEGVVFVNKGLRIKGSELATSFRSDYAPWRKTTDVEL